MTFQKGQSGNPFGRAKTKEVTDALRIVSLEIDPETKKRKIRLMAEKLFELAIAGDVSAIREVSDRLEGKSVASVDIKTREHDPRDVPDSTLIDIATASSAGTAPEEGGAKEPNSVH